MYILGQRWCTLYSWRLIPVCVGSSVMPRLKAVVWPLAGNFWVKIADFASRTQDNRTIVTNFDFDTRHGRQQNEICRVFKALEHVLLLVYKALSMSDREWHWLLKSTYVSFTSSSMTTYGQKSAKIVESSSWTKDKGNVVARFFMFFPLSLLKHPYPAAHAEAKIWTGCCKVAHRY